MEHVKGHDGLILVQVAMESEDVDNGGLGGINELLVFNFFLLCEELPFFTVVQFECFFLFFCGR